MSTNPLGHVYLLANPALGGMVKIGYTSKSTTAPRVAELSASSSIPLPFEVHACWLVDNPSQWEARIHSRLASCRVASNREFFRIPPEEAEEVINRLIYGTNEPGDVLRSASEGLVRLYRLHRGRFSPNDSLVEKLEAALRDAPDA